MTRDRALIAACIYAIAPGAAAQIINQTGAFYSVSASAEGIFSDTQTSMQTGDFFISSGMNTGSYSAGAQIQLTKTTQDRYEGIIVGLGISRSYSYINTSYDIDFDFQFTLSQPATVTFGTNLNGWRYQANGGGVTAFARMSLLDEQGALLAFLEAPEFFASVDTVAINLVPGVYTWNIDAAGIVPNGDSGQTSAESLLYPLLTASAIEPCSPADLTTTGATLSGQLGFGFPDGVADLDDLGYYLNRWLDGSPLADLTTIGATLPGQVGFGEPDGDVGLDDLGYYLNFWLEGCP